MSDSFNPQTMRSDEFIKATIPATQNFTTEARPAAEIAVGVDKMTADFGELNLLPQVLAAIAASGYRSPTEIQAAIIPEILAGRDVLAQSQTGTGKTAAFACPLLSMIDVAERHPQVLVLTPTRELAIQVAKSFEVYAAKIAGFSVAAICGGQDYDVQFRLLKRGVQVVVGTPGRVIDHIERGTLALGQIRCLVLDEADEMLNMGFLDDVKFVLQRLPESRQIALFSATLPGPIREIAAQYLHDPARITARARTMTAENIRQQAVLVETRYKLDVLQRLLEVESADGVIVFTKTRVASVQVAERLQREGLSAVALNGQMPQKQRERTIEKFKAGQLDVLVATDVAARGLDVSRVSHVFNFDLPQDHESYIHRIGRTGRAGRHGKAILLLSKSQRRQLKAIEKATRQAIEIIPAPTSMDVASARTARFKQQLATAMARRPDLSRYEQLISEISAEIGCEVLRIAAALVAMQAGHLRKPHRDATRGGHGGHEPQNDDESSTSTGRHRAEDGDRSDRPARGERREGRSTAKSKRSTYRTSLPRPGMERYRIEIGRDDGVMPRNIVGAMINEAGLDSDAIGPIQLYDTYSTVDLPVGMPPALREFLQDVWVSGKKMRISLLETPLAHEPRDGRRRGAGAKASQRPFKSTKKSLQRKNRNRQR